MKTKILIWGNIKWQEVSWFIGLTLVAAILPRFIHNQFVTGPIINATLFLAAANLSVGSAILVGLIPSVVALSSGLLPLPLAPMVPFIMISNTILIVIFSKIKETHFSAAAIASSMAKYLFLYLTAQLIINTLMPQNLAAKAAAQMMAWPQLVTALVGAIIAFGVIKIINIKRD